MILTKLFITNFHEKLRKLLSFWEIVTIKDVRESLEKTQF